MAAYELAPALGSTDPDHIIGPGYEIVLRNPQGKPVEISIITLTKMLNEAYAAGVAAAIPS